MGLALGYGIVRKCDGRASPTREAYHRSLTQLTQRVLCRCGSRH